MVFIKKTAFIRVNMKMSNFERKCSTGYHIICLGKTNSTSKKGQLVKVDSLSDMV